MYPVLFKVGPFNIYSYGVMVALGFSLAALLICRNASKFDLDKDKMLDMTIIILISGIIGARVFYVLSNFKYYLTKPLEIPDLSKGGLVWYGAFLSALAAAVWYSKKNRMKSWSVADLLAPYIALAHAFGRIGCFLNGCCYGIEVSGVTSLGVIFPNDHAIRYPTQIYSSLVLVLLFAVLRAWQERRHFEGEIFLAYCALYSLERFFMEFLRGDNPRIFMGLTLFQLISIVIFCGSLILFIERAVMWKRGASVLK